MVQREISLPTQRLFWLGGKPQKTLIKTWIYIAIKDSALVAQRTQFAFLRRAASWISISIVQSPSSEANWFAASQKIPRLSRNPKVHYRTHKLPPPVSILGQPSPVHKPTSHLLEIHPNITHPSTPRSPQWFLPSGFPTKTLYTPLPSPIRATCPAHLILLDFITHTILGEQYKSFSSSLCNLLYSPVLTPFKARSVFTRRVTTDAEESHQKRRKSRWRCGNKGQGK